MSATAELTLGRPSDIVKSVAFAAERSERMRRLEQYLEALEEERKKVEAFKRELPFCLQLLSHAIQVSKEQLADCQHPKLKCQPIAHRYIEDGSKKQSANGRPILEDYIPLKNDPCCSTFEDGRKHNRASEQTSAENCSGVIQTKYWSQAQAFAHGEKMVSLMMEKHLNATKSLQQNQEQSRTEPAPRSQGGAFLPFSRDRLAPSACTAGSVDEPSALSRQIEDGDVCPHGDFEELTTSSRGGSPEQRIHQSKDTPNATISNNSGQAYSLPQRKARRCWSPELHRRFVDALQLLGGSQVATPKLIRELMKVEGLTNDEVKSHLQKYRLHNRRPASSVGFQSAASQAPQLVVLGGIWVPEYISQADAADAAQQKSSSLSNPAQHQFTRPHSTDSYIQVNTTSQLQLRPSVHYDDHQQEAMVTHDLSQRSISRAGPLQLTGRPSNHTLGREDSMDEDSNEGSSWKDEFRDVKISDAEERGDSSEGNVHAQKRKYRLASEKEGSDLETSTANESA